ncbi:MAG TPA: vWA domain-containing protein [Gaiellaceae bacterium]|nr:vWA domain-containing protein [Gaiellaceae bacterium]
MPVFLTPIAGLVALGALLPIAAAVVRERRLRGVRGVLGLQAPTRASAFGGAAAAAAAIALLGLAAAQPAVARSDGVRVRTDAQAYVVVDNSRSMEAVQRRGGRSRFVRAKALALRLRDAVPQLPWGVASFNDRTLAHTFPTGDRGTFADTLAQSIGIERPPPVFRERTATALDTIGQTAIAGFFSPHARKRLVVLFTDGESRPFAPRSLAYMLGQGHVHLLIVRLWNAGDRVYDARGHDLGYRPAPGSTAELQRLERVGIRVLPEADFGAAPGIVRRFLGSGPTAEPQRRRRLTPLAPVAVLASIVPFGFVLVRSRR